MKTIVLISCVSKKLPYPAKAKDLYISNLFKLSLQYAKSLDPDAIYVLSSKYGLTPLDLEIEPYEKTLNRMLERERKQWAGKVLAQLKDLADLKKDKFIFLAGKKYREYLLSEIAKHDVPLQNLRIGEQLQYLKNRIERRGNENCRARNERRGMASNGSRLTDLNRFYEILKKIEQKTGGKRILNDCNARMNCPRRGIYFFFEKGESRQNEREPRVARIGTHAVSANAKSTLWRRLKAHKGRDGGKHEGGGNHRGSIFRLHVGTAIINREGLSFDSWGIGSSGGADLRDKEHPLEIRVSETIRSMPFLWLEADDDLGPNSIRKYIERNSIALLSNFNRESIDPPSPGWLGQYCSNEKVRKSGLWNVDHVDEGYDTAFLEVLSRLVEKWADSRFNRKERYQDLKKECSSLSIKLAINGNHFSSYMQKK